jgi:large subunit ribosomal protein L29
MSKAQQYRDLSLSELEAALNDARKELFQLANEVKKAKKADKPHLVSLKKKDIARMLTVLTEKQSTSDESLA